MILNINPSYDLQIARLGMTYLSTLQSEIRIKAKQMEIMKVDKKTCVQYNREVENAWAYRIYCYLPQEGNLLHN